ncbi:MAG: hypothetical protein Q9200_002274 [Gallowayella weberi]
MGKSPLGKYGFQITTHLAYVDNDNSWSDSWEHWYARALKRMLEEEEERSHGPDDELATTGDRRTSDTAMSHPLGSVARKRKRSLERIHPKLVILWGHEATVENYMPSQFYELS